MRFSITIFVCSIFLSCGRAYPKDTPQDRYNNSIARLNQTNGGMEVSRFYALDFAAKDSFSAGKIDEARKYAEEIMTLLPKYKESGNYGNGVQDANLVLGRIAVLEGRIKDARRHLIAAGNTPGSSVLLSFGPNMSLAKDLLEKGERNVVLEYLVLCRKFWTDEDGRLNEWINDVKAGKIPDFGYNLGT